MSFSIKNPQALRERERRSTAISSNSTKSKKQPTENNVPLHHKTLKRTTSVDNGKIVPRRYLSGTINNPNKLEVTKKLGPQSGQKFSKTKTVVRGEISAVVPPLSKLRPELERKPPLIFEYDRLASQSLPGKWATSSDKKLLGIPFVKIILNCPNRSYAAMKLRKVLPKKVDKKDDISSDSEEESDGGEEISSIDESHTDASSSEAETESDDEEVFDKSKPRTYPLRRKSVKSPVVHRRRTETPTRAESASDSSSESLLDIPPTCGSSHKWNYTPSSPISKSPKRGEEKSDSPRALRSKSTDIFSHALDALQFARQAAAAATSSSSSISFTPHKILKKVTKPVSAHHTSTITTKSPRRSPERDRLLRDKPFSSSSTKDHTASTVSRDISPELEKSYSFRHLESKLSSSQDYVQKPKKTKPTSVAAPQPLPPAAASSSTSISSPTKTTLIAVDNTATAPPDPPLSPPRIKRKPGRPRKDKSLIPSIPVEQDVPPAKRTRRTTSTSNELAKIPSVPRLALDKVPRPSTTTTIDGPPPIKRFPGRPRKYPDPNKQQRDAIAQRARQSKIMAKSRVLQSNKYSFNASWRKPINQDSDSTSSVPTKSESSKTRYDIDEDHSSSSSSIEESGSASGENSSSSDNQQKETILPSLIQPRPVFKSSYKPKNSPVAQCEICDLTFTRKFSLTKHLATRQHQRMLRKHGIKETRQLKLIRQDKKRASKFGEILDLKSEDMTEELPVAQDENNENQESSLLQDNEEEEEEVEEVKVQEWLSGRAVGVNNYVCDVCGDIFIKKFDFAAHLWSHRSGSDLVCSDCGLKFAESDVFNEHIDSAHTPDIKFCCKICPSKFSREDYLLKHVHSHKQDADEKFMCSACDKKFTTHELLSRHFDIKHLQLGKPKVELFTDDTYSFASHLLLAQRSLAAQTDGDEEIDNNFENHDPNLEEDDEEEDEEDEEEEAEEDEDEENEYGEVESEDDEDVSLPLVPQKDWVRTLNNKTRVIDSATRQQSGSVQSQSLDVRTYLKRSWLHDNSIIGCGISSDESIPPFSYSPLCCKDCGKTFETRKLLVKHVDYVNHAERYMCPVCKKAFKWRYLLNRHMTRHSRGKEQLKKKQAKFSKMKSRLLKQRKPAPPLVKKPLPKLVPLIQSKPTPYALLVDPGTYLEAKDVLPKVTTALATPRLSVASSTSKGIIPIPARIPLSKGITTSSTPKPKQSILITSATASTTPKLSNNKSTVTIKKKKFTLVDNLDPLGPSVSGSVGDQDREVASTSGASRSTPLEPQSSLVRKSTFEPNAGLGNKFFSCELCSKSFTDKNTLTVHTWFHQSESLYSCPDCDAKCERKSDFELHYKCHETNQPFFLCYVCFKPFRWKKDMIRHVRKKHPDEKTYRCLYCNERFRVNDELNDHISESHAKHRNYPCEYCGKRYAQKRYLLLHIRTQHGIDESSGMEMEMEVNPDQYLIVEDMVEEGDVDGCD